MKCAESSIEGEKEGKYPQLSNCQQPFVCMLLRACKCDRAAVMRFRTSGLVSGGG